MDRPIIFISHIHEEKELAVSLKDFIDKSFLKIPDVFVSSDVDSIELGCKWLDRITDSLKNCSIELILCSNKSILKPWINFEAGAGWIRSCKVIPICHSGLLPESLPLPLNLLQAMILSSEKKLQELIDIISKEIGCNKPNVDYRNFLLNIKELENKYSYGKDVEFHLLMFLDFIRKYCFMELKAGKGRVFFDNKVFLDSIGKGVIFPRFIVNSSLIDPRIRDCIDFLNKAKILQIVFCGSMISPEGTSQYFYIKKMECFDEAEKFLVE